MKSMTSNRVTSPRIALAMVAIATAVGSASCGPSTGSNTDHPGQVATSNSASANPGPTATQPSVSAATLKLNGTYAFTLTKGDAIAHGTAGDKSAEGLANYPNTITVRLDQNKWMWKENGSFTADGTYDVASDKIAFTWAREGIVITLGLAVDATGNLHLTPIGPMDDGDRFVWTTETWMRQS